MFPSVSCMITYFAPETLGDIILNRVNVRLKMTPNGQNALFRPHATPNQIILNVHDDLALKRHNKLKYGYSTL